MKKITSFIQRSINAIGLITILLAAGLTSSRAQNTWSQKADFGGIARTNAVGFSIGSKGYIGTGGVYPNSYKDFWEYDPALDSWAQKADFGGGERVGAIGFSIGDRGYIVCGLQQLVAFHNDLWEYNPDTNSWIQKADFPAEVRYGAVGFSIDSKGYVGTGNETGQFFKDFWEYDPGNDTWTQKADFGGDGREGGIGFSIGDKGYVGTGTSGGYYIGSHAVRYKDFWEYDPNSDTWTQKADFGGTAREYAVGFSIGSKGYIGTGVNNNYPYNEKDFWEYDPNSDTWTQKADFVGAARSEATGFSIGSKGYIGTGLNNNYPYNEKDFWEYTPDTSVCITPSNPSAIDITSTSAKAEWDAVPGAEKYKLRYEVAATNDWMVLYPVAHHKEITGLSPNTAYTWQVKTLCQADSPSVVSLWSAKKHFTTASSRLIDNAPTQPALQIYPNPAQDYASIQFTLLQPSKVMVIVCDIAGREIDVLMNDQLPTGEHSVQLNTSKFSKGIYVMKMITDDGIENQKLIIQ